MDSTFNEFKNIMCSATMLHQVDASKPFILSTDASKFSTTSVLLQTVYDGLEYPGVDNHLADSLSCNPAFLSDVKAEQEFNTKVMIPPSAILSSPPHGNNLQSKCSRTRQIRPGS
ncbi:hypothetical protein DSO57_1008159 [Entomophthora muscae]|uniref:Uncharacterized protein n=1 Tax=Entomophthora muscae TaxID=34485 RepID=A0ACC2T6Y5_9FUNG|nr:hypothetical protein DSO57_1008159 [Entomophthora muscae]